MNFKEIACDKECQFQEGPSYRTAMGWTPTYDKEGRLLNSDPNITTTDVRCTTCGKEWKASRQHGKTTFMEVITK